MEHYGIRGTVLDWFSSYLSNRLQYVYMNDTSSIMQNINIGVPQGSVLGPLLFLLYINDIQFVSKIFHAIIYADDTNLFLSGEKIDFLCNTANSELVKFSEWFASNKLKINVTKTCCMLFKPKNKQINFSDIKLFIDNCCIPLVHSTHFLGVVIDDKLTWKNHISYISNKISRVIGAISRLKKILPHNILLTFYQSLIVSHLIYCNIVWGGCSSAHVNRLFLLQKRVIRVITDSAPFSHTNPLFFKFRQLKIHDIHKLQVAIFMFSYLHNILPKFLNDCFQENNLTVPYTTRQSNHIRVPKLKYEFSRSTVIFIGPKLWNCLDPNIKNCPTLSRFKKMYINDLIKSYTP